MSKLIKVGLPVHINELFDYLLTDIIPPLGARVVVPFGKRTLVGVVLDFADESQLPVAKLKTVLSCLDREALISSIDIKLVFWASNYYHEPIGIVVSNLFPVYLRANNNIDAVANNYYMIDDASGVKRLKKSPQQDNLYAFISQFQQGVSHWQLLYNGYKDSSINALLQKKHIKKVSFLKDYRGNKCKPSAITLNVEQNTAIAAIDAVQNHQVFLLEGITGSGKTQVYLEVIAKVLAAGKQALVMLPEIGLTPQILQCFKARFDVNIVALHSKLSEVARFAAWMQVVSGEARLVIGTRLSVFTPIPDLGIIIIDEEHDASFKQQTGFRYSARDLAIVKAKMSDVRVVLGTATPSLESYYNAEKERYSRLKLLNRAGGANLPKVSLVDMRNKKLAHGLSPAVITAIGRHLAQDCQVLLFLNRRGYSPVVLCHSCGWSAKCPRCETNYTYHKGRNMLYCHSCEAQKQALKRCVDCDSEEILQVGLGTERLEEGLLELFPDTLITRVDRDMVSRKVGVGELLQSAYTGKSQILVGTQMLAKGHHLPKLTLVAIIDADGALYSSDFRAIERLMQTIVQVAGRSGRAEIAGEVLIQTHFPDNHFLQCVVSSGYPSFIQSALAERAKSSMPPYAALALLTVEALELKVALDFLAEIRSKSDSFIFAGVQMLGPMTAAIPKRSGKYRAQILIHGVNKATLQGFLKLMMTVVYKSKDIRKVRWALDVDPMEVL